MRLSLGFSPCPNDTFIFDALIHHKIDTEGLEFEVIMADVEALNRKAFLGELDITKLSYNAYGFLNEKYVLLNSGSALGNNCGPLLIAKQEIPTERLKDCKIAIPGKYTTANFLCSMAFPDVTHKIEVLFSDIEEKVLSGEVEAGVIIHENRFTYAQKGLVKLIDLGEYWQTETHLPIPLGGIAIKRSIPTEIQRKVDRLICQSIEYAFQNPESSRSFVRKHSQEMSEEVMFNHIQLYVNEYSIDLGEMGQKAVREFYRKAIELGWIEKIIEPLFV